MQDEFEDFMDQQARQVGGEWFDGKVAGVTRQNVDGTERQAIALSLAPFEELQLVPEPENRFDPNAVKVLDSEGLQVGYLEARLAAEVTRRQVAGMKVRCFVRAIRTRGDVAGVSFGLLQWTGSS